MSFQVFFFFFHGRKPKKHNKNFFDLAFWGTQLIPSICGHPTTHSTPGLLNSGILFCCFCFDKDRVSPRQLRLASDSGTRDSPAPWCWIVAVQHCKVESRDLPFCWPPGTQLAFYFPSLWERFGLPQMSVFLCLDELKGILDSTVFLLLIFWGTGFCLCIISILIYMFTNNDQEFIFFPPFPLYCGTSYWA